MNEYHKIQTMFLRNPDTNFKTLLDGQYALPEFAYLANNEWIFTEKVDGTNIRIKISNYHENGKAYGVTFGGKTDAAQIPATLVAKLEELFHTDTQREKMAEMFPDGACLYGEGYGAKIQKGGGNYRSDQDFVLFDVKVGDFWLEPHNVTDVATKLGISLIPTIGRGTLNDMVEMVRNTSLKSKWGDFCAEGIVARPATPLRTRNGSRIITKLKRKDFGL